MNAADATGAGGGRGSALALGGLLALVIGCFVLGGIVAISRNERTTHDAGSASSVNAPRDEPASLDGPFHYAAVRRRREARPARFDAALPVGPHAFVDGWTDAHPPRSYVRDRVCAGDPVMGERWLAAIAGGPAVGSPSDSDAYTRLFAGCASARLCEWAGELLRSDREPNVLRPVWRLAARCDGPAIVALFREREVPPEAYLAWTEAQVVYDVRGGRLPPQIDVAKLARAVEALAAGDEAAPEDAPALPALLGMVDDPRAAETLLRMHAATRNVAKRHGLAMAMHLQRDPRARRIFEADCASFVPADSFCTVPAASLPTAPPEPEPAVIPVEPAAFSRLRALGLLGTSKPGGGVAETTIELLEQSGRALDVEYAEEDDSLARALAALVAPVLDDVFFQASEASRDGVADTLTTLSAWSRGERFDVELGLGDETEASDVETVVGLLNVLARARGSSARFVVQGIDGTAEFVVAGLERSLRAAIAEGLIQVSLGLAPSGETAGDAFLRALRGEPVD